MSQTLQYNPAAAHRILDSKRLQELSAPLLEARDEAFRDVELLSSGGPIPAAKQPLDAGFIELPAKLLAKGDAGLLGEIQSAAAALRDNVDRVVSLGIGGSSAGARALFQALRNPFHNELERAKRNGIPRLYFEGDNLDNDSTHDLLELLEEHCEDKNDLLQRWGVVVISKSGGTLETAVAFRIFREALEKLYGAGSEESRRYIVPITGETGKLRNLASHSGYEHVLPIPDNVGGRFSVLTAVGLLPAAILGLDVHRLLEGAAAMTQRCRIAPIGENPVLDYVATCHLFERDHGMTIRVLSTWGKHLEALGLWYDQLLSESLGKGELGATPVTVVNTRDLHSRGQQHQEGRRDKVITNVFVETPSTEPLSVPTVSDDLNQDQLNRYGSKTIPDLLLAAYKGTNQAYADVGRPTADITLPALDEYSIGELLQMLMLATVVEGRLIGINPYGQPGVEDYKQNMAKVLNAG